MKENKEAYRMPLGHQRRVGTSQLEIAVEFCSDSWCGIVPYKLRSLFCVIYYFLCKVASVGWLGQLEPLAELGSFFSSVDSPHQ